jgi:hypothetical protein
MKILITALIMGGLIACMADAEAWNLFLVSKAVGVVALATGGALILALQMEQED